MTLFSGHNSGPFSGPFFGLFAAALTLTLGGFAEPAFATSVMLSKYCDCYSFQTPNLPVFARSESGASLAHYRSHDMQNCVEIRLDQDTDGHLTKIFVGDSAFSLDDLFPGPVYFGVRKKIAHSMELVDFDPQTGGILRFSFLKSLNFFDAFQDDFSIYDSGARRARIPEELHEIIRGPHWSALELTVARQTSGEWVLRNDKGDKVPEILALMKGRQLLGIGFVTGINSMVLASEGEQSAYSRYKCVSAQR